MQQESVDWKDTAETRAAELAEDARIIAELRAQLALEQKTNYWNELWLCRQRLVDAEQARERVERDLHRVYVGTVNGSPGPLGQADTILAIWNRGQAERDKLRELLREASRYAGLSDDLYKRITAALKEVEHEIKGIAARIRGGKEE